MALDAFEICKLFHPFTFLFDVFLRDGVLELLVDEISVAVSEA